MKSQIAKAIGKKSKAEGPTLPAMKTHYKAIINKTVWSWCKKSPKKP